MNCLICEQELQLCWTDVHGVAQCTTCGVPYRVLHYKEGTHERVDLPPTCLVLDDWKPLIVEYWKENKRCLPSGHSVPGGQEIATRDDVMAFNAWCDKNKDRLPKETEEIVE